MQGACDILFGNCSNNVAEAKAILIETTPFITVTEKKI